MSSSMALAKRHESDMALMPPPPIKRIKRPAVVIDEDEYTEALTDIIARDYFPGLAEVRAQDEYLSALESKNDVWIAEAGRKLRTLATQGPEEKRRRQERDATYDTPRTWSHRTPVADTPRGKTGEETPMNHARDFINDTEEQQKQTAISTSNLSLSAFQAKYTSEDNESFNQVLDKQNNKKREKYAHLWTGDQMIPSNRLIEHRMSQAKSIKQKEEDLAVAVSEGRELIPITTGAIASRPAKPDSWHQKRPDNTFMFNAPSIDEDGMQTVMEVKEANSKAGPKEIVYANTRFPPLQTTDDPGPVPPSPSLNTTIIARRDLARANRAESESTFTGAETPRVNGYAFVDEDEPGSTPPPANPEPSYRDLLAGQVLDSQPNPFTIHDKSKREELHHRLVDREKAKRRAKERETMRTPVLAGGGGGGVGKTPLAGNMTPAARKLMDKLGRTPVAAQRGKTDRLSSHDMWTPGTTPRRK